MRKIILLLFTLAIWYTSFSQNCFIKTVGDLTHNENSFSAIELSSGGFIITCEKTLKTLTKSNPYFLKISDAGVIQSKKYLEDTTRGFSYKAILNFNSKIVIIGIFQNSAHSDSLLISELDTNLNLIQTNSIYITDSLRTAFFQVKNFKDSLMLISGYFDKGNSSLQYNSFLIYIDSTFNVNSFISPILYGSMSHELNNLVYCKGDSTFNTYITVNHIGSYKCKLDISLNIDSLYSQYSYSIEQPIFIESVDSIFLMMANIKGNRIKLLTLDSNLDSISSQLIGGNASLNYPAVNRSLSSKSGYVFAGITENINPNNIWWGMQNSNFYVMKLDSLGNTIWDKKIGDVGSYYLLYDVLATKDGGCLLLGNVYKYKSNTFQKDIIIVKLDSNGTTTWTQKIPTPNEGIDLFPNPASTTISLKLNNANQQIQSLRILDMQGKTMIQQMPYRNQLQIDISTLSSGVYIIEGQTQSGAVFRRKFVKK